MQGKSFMRFFVALGATVNLSPIFRHGALLSAHASPESSSSLSSLPTTSVASGVEGKVWQRGVEVSKNEGEGESSNQLQAGTTTLEDNRPRTITGRGGRQGLSASSRLGRLLGKSSWRKLSKVLVSVTMAVAVASLLLTLRKISSMCTAKLGELKSQPGGGLSDGGEASKASRAQGENSVEGVEAVPEICRTLGLAQSHGEEALARTGKDKTVKGENFLQKLLKTRLSQQAIAAAVVLLIISLASAAHATSRPGYGTKPDARGYVKRYFVFDKVTCHERPRKYCDVTYEEPSFGRSIFAARYHQREIHHIAQEKDGVEYHYVFWFSDAFIGAMDRLGVYKDNRYWVAYEWAHQLRESQASGRNVPLGVWYKRPRRTWSAV